jgi:hypothetical protein
LVEGADHAQAEEIPEIVVPYEAPDLEAIATNEVQYLVKLIQGVHRLLSIRGMLIGKKFSAERTSRDPPTQIMEGEKSHRVRDRDEEATAGTEEPDHLVETPVRVRQMLEGF